MRAIWQVMKRERTPSRVAVLASVLITAFSLPNVARAGCMTAPTMELQTLADMAGRDPISVLRVTERDRRNAMTASSFGWRQAARAEAYDTLSRPADARRTAGTLIEREPASRSPLYVELLTRYAMNGFRAEELERALPMIDLGRKRQERGS